MVYLLYGNEPYKIFLKISALTKECECRKTEKLDQEDEQYLNYFGLLGTRCLIVDVASLGADDEIYKLCKKNAHGKNIVILRADSVNERTKLFAYLSKNGTVIKCDKIGYAELVRFVQTGVKKYHCVITEDALKAFIDRSGYLMEDGVTLDKICICIKQLAFRTSEIQLQDVETILPLLPNDDTRNLLNHLLTKDLDGFMKRSSELVELKDPIALMGLILRHFRIAYKASLLQGEKNVAKTLGLSDYQMKRIQPVLQLTPEQVMQCIDIILKGTEKIKSGVVSPKCAFISSMGNLADVIIC